ncbi:MAG: NnrS family protein [Candidatus Thiodiazotropha sp.]
MGVIPLGERPAPSTPPAGWRPFGLGFRPFFALAGLSGLGLMLLWIAAWQTGSPPSAYSSLVDWHSHQMLFGFSIAIIAGFLLTAVRNWTGIETPTGKPLALLALLWLIGRLLPLIPAVASWLVALVDWLFIPTLIIVLTPPLVNGQNPVNRLFLPLLGAMAVANLLYHLQMLGFASTGQAGISLMLNLILLLMIFVAGRILPFFTEKAINGARPRFNKLREQSVYALFILWTLGELLMPNSWLISPLAFGVAITQAWRLLDWHHPAVWRRPILWVLYSGLCWLVAGFLLKTLALLQLYPNSLATHALTVGAIGVFTLGMMARVALGHTGRDMEPKPSIVTAFILFNVAALIRVGLPVTGLVSYQACITLAGALWSLGYLLFVITYLPILLRPRIDGRPG